MRWLRTAPRFLNNRTPNAREPPAAGRLVAVEHSDWQEWLTGFAYALDPAGNRVAVTETTSALLVYQLPALGETAQSPPAPPLEPLAEGLTAEQVEVIRYGYDDDDRLTSAVYQGGDLYEYAYDPVGNRTALTTTAGTTGYTYDDADRLTAVDGVRVTYDNRGNLTSDGAWTYTYNAAGRMVRAETITATQVYTLVPHADPQGHNVLQAAMWGLPSPDHRGTPMATACSWPRAWTASRPPSPGTSAALSRPWHRSRRRLG